MSSGPSRTGEFTGPLPSSPVDGGQPDGGSRGRRGIIAAVTAGALVAAGAVGYALMGRETAGADDGSGSSTSEEYARGLVGAVAEGATVSCVEITERVYGSDSVLTLPDGTKTVVFVDPSQGVNAKVPPKASSHAVNVPLKPVEGVSLQDVRDANICLQPSLAGTMLNAQGRMEFGNSSFATIAAEAGWNMPAQGDGNEIAAYANGCYPEDRNSATAEEVGKHLACEDNAERAITLLRQGEDRGVVVSDTILTYRLAAPTTDPTKYTVPNFEVLTNPGDQEDDGSFLATEFGDNKTVGCLAVVGVNVGTKSEGESGGDQRAALLPCEGEETPETTPSHPTSNSSTPPSTPPSHRPSPTPTPTPSSTPTPSGGKHQSDAPAPDRPIVPAPSGGYVDRDGQPHEEPYTPPASTVPPEEVGKGDSDSGAVNTVDPPATSEPAAEVPVTTAPTAAPQMP